MSIHKSLSLGSGLSTSRSVFTRRERIEKLMDKGSFDEGGSVYGLPKVRTKYKVLSKKQLKAVAAAANFDLSLMSAEDCDDLPLERRNSDRFSKADGSFFMALILSVLDYLIYLRTSVGYSGLLAHWRLVTIVVSRVYRKTSRFRSL